MRLIPGHLGQHCPGGGGRGLVQGGRAHSTSLQSMGCGMKTACRCVVRNINDYGYSMVIDIALLYKWHLCAAGKYTLMSGAH